jgi:hypothetical protein
VGSGRAMDEGAAVELISLAFAEGNLTHATMSAPDGMAPITDGGHAIRPLHQPSEIHTQGLSGVESMAATN